MYAHLYRVITAFALLAVAIVPATQAQSSMLKARVPFDFVVGEKTLPSGEYQVKAVNPTSVSIQSNDSSSSAMVLTSATQAGKILDVGKLVFNRYDDEYFLSKIWVPSSDTGRELRKSRLEREIAARSIEKPGATVVAVAGKK